MVFEKNAKKKFFRKIADPAKPDCLGNRGIHSFLELNSLQTHIKKYQKLITNTITDVPKLTIL